MIAATTKWDLQGQKGTQFVYGKGDKMNPKVRFFAILFLIKAIVLNKL